MCGGRSQPMPKPLTRAEMEAATDNPFENPNSGVTAPSWKPDEVKKEKAAREALKISEAAAARTDTAEVTPRSSSGMSNADKAKRKANQDRAKHNFNKKKYSKGITGKKTKNA
tara:strand:- start:949 stop:1287 length:339 start_codon:yes stop_codon:yes gene_type:complete